MDQVPPLGPGRTGQGVDERVLAPRPAEQPEPVVQPFQRLQPVPQGGRPLELEPGRGRLHLSADRPEQAPVPAGQVKGVKLTRLGRRVYSNSLKPMEDPWGRQIFWIGGGSISWTGPEDSDFQAVQDGYVSVTPLHLDLTHFHMLEAPESWWRDL